MNSPVSTNDAGTIHKLLDEIENRVDQINKMQGIRDNTGPNAKPVHAGLYNIRGACKAIKEAVGSGKG